MESRLKELRRTGRRAWRRMAAIDQLLKGDMAYADMVLLRQEKEKLFLEVDSIIDEIVKIEDVQI